MSETSLAIPSDTSVTGRRRASFWRLLLSRSSGRLGVFIVTFHLMLAVSAPLFIPYGIAAQSEDVFAPPSAVHWFGTDQLGRDVLSRTIMGGRVVLVVTLPAAALAMLWGGAAGMVLGLVGRRTDDVLMRVVDAFLAIPWLLFFLLIVGVFEGGVAVMIPTLGFFYGLPILRVARASTLQVRMREFVVAAQLRGESAFTILCHEISPNVSDTIIVDATMQWSWMIIAFSALSFLGLGVSPPTPDWGRMIADARGFLTVAPWAVVPPCVALVTLIIGLNFLSDAVGKALGVDLTHQGAI